jgi:hypothetical protein
MKKEATEFDTREMGGIKWGFGYVETIAEVASVGLEGFGGKV